MDKLTQNVVDTLLDWGADLVGIAPVSRFANAPEGHRPPISFPVQSVISVALHIFQGMADVWGEYDEPGKTITPYLFYGYGLTNLESSRMVNRMAKILEYQGYKTLCFMPTWVSSFYKYLDETVATNKVRAEFSHRHAAAAAGLGTLGWNGLGLTRIRLDAAVQFHPHVRRAGTHSAVRWSTAVPSRGVQFQVRAGLPCGRVF